ncbi:MAG: acetyl-CoA C-acyltransferase, partial [Acidobacteria bacterium]|nr:acetyl-CoA C-acyltransferase [Acidobacteriota bacterium]MDW7985360.1 acetyl-CoA C-acyltransferase [Acidobacteriota bacterium]
SQTSDGAAAVLLASEPTIKQLRLNPWLRFVDYTYAGVAPEVMGLGPVEALRRLVHWTDVALGMVDVVELNEAFAAQVLAVLRELPELDPAKINPNGGAIALGHPLGCTGARQTVTLMHELKRCRGKYGIVTMCVGGGMGAAALFENVMT